MTSPSPIDVQRILAAGAAGESAALMQLAVWRLTGQAGPRDLPEAQRLLRRAAKAGHVDGALMEIALTANGSGGPVDWGAARDLLGLAAKTDPIAAAQVALLARMALREDGSPVDAPGSKVLSQSPGVALFAGFLTPAECAHVASVAANVMEPSLVLDPATGRAIAHPVRRCDNAVIGPTREDLVVRAINLRIAAASGTTVEQGEPLTVLRYGPGHEYKPHHDGLPGVANQRIRTVLIYLNQGFAGGETRFMANGLTITPCGGDAILFDNVDASGRIDPRSQHAGLPVTRGVKWLATRWIRAAPLDPWAA